MIDVNNTPVTDVLINNSRYAKKVYMNDTLVYEYNGVSFDVVPNELTAPSTSTTTTTKRISPYCMVKCGDCYYLATSANTNFDVGYTTVALSQLLKFDPNAGTIVAVKTFRAELSLFVYGNLIYIVPSRNITNCIFVYDTTADTFTTVSLGASYVFGYPDFQGIPNTMRWIDRKDNIVTFAPYRIIEKAPVSVVKLKDDFVWFTLDLTTGQVTERTPADIIYEDLYITDATGRTTAYLNTKETGAMQDYPTKAYSSYLLATDESLSMQSGQYDGAVDTTSYSGFYDRSMYQWVEVVNGTVTLYRMAITPGYLVLPDPADIIDDPADISDSKLNYCYNGYISIRDIAGYYSHSALFKEYEGCRYGGDVEYSGVPNTYIALITGFHPVNRANTFKADGSAYTPAVSAPTIGWFCGSTVKDSNVGASVLFPPLFMIAGDKSAKAPPAEYYIKSGIYDASPGVVTRIGAGVIELPNNTYIITNGSNPEGYGRRLTMYGYCGFYEDANNVKGRTGLGVVTSNNSCILPSSSMTLFGANSVFATTDTKLKYSAVMPDTVQYCEGTYDATAGQTYIFPQCEVSDTLKYFIDNILIIRRA